MANGGWVVSGTDANGDVWVVHADKKETADHIADLFRKEGYKNVTVTQVP